LEKEKARTVVEKTEKKKVKRKQNDKAAVNAFEAIKNTKLGSKVNTESLKTLLGSTPMEPNKPERMKLKSLLQFDPFALSEP